MIRKGKVAGIQTNKWSRKNFSRGYKHEDYDVSLVDVTWNRLENNSDPAGTAAIQSSLIQNFGVRLPSDYGGNPTEGK